MPIVYRAEEGGWGLENPTPEEVKDLQDYAIRAVKDQLGDSLAEMLMREMAMAHMRRKMEQSEESDDDDEGGPKTYDGPTMN